MKKFSGLFCLGLAWLIFFPWIFPLGFMGHYRHMATHSLELFDIVICVFTAVYPCVLIYCSLEYYRRRVLSLALTPLGLVFVMTLLTMAGFASSGSAGIGSLSDRAEKGDPAAQYNLGYNYHAGEGVPQSDAEAFKWWNRAASQGNADAEFALGYMYDTKPGLKDEDKAMSWYALAAEHGSLQAQDILGSMYFYGGHVQEDPERAFRLFKNPAERGFINAQRGLCYLYQNPDIGGGDYVEAMKWCRKAAAQNDAVAMEEIGSLYERGQGVPANQETAFSWYYKSAENGNINFAELGEHYYAGQGVEQNYARAYYWFLLDPRTEGTGRWVTKRDAAAAHLSPLQIADIKSRVGEWSPKSQKLLPP
ncbi:MAG: Sel1 repeat domain protein [Micavibrio sp.]|nr:Sel1 repeat domain protein [Micavibrio sp.]